MHTRYATAFLFVLFVSAPSHVELLSQQLQQLSGETVNYHYDTLARNEISMWTSNVGSMSHNPLTHGYGFEWPKGNGRYYIYQDGLLFSGLSSGERLAGGVMYNTAWQAGYIHHDGAPHDPNDPRMRLFRARDLDSSVYAALPLNEQTVLRKDYQEWPADIGAPWVDVNADGHYEPDFDAWLQSPSMTDGPFMPGDEVLWCVMNDLDARIVRDLFGSTPVGIELRITVWSHDRPDCRARAIFTKYQLIHKGINSLDSMYLSLWCDPDVGFAFDDYVGMDTTLQMAYVYNAFQFDSLHGNIGVLGYLLLQGPVVPSQGSVARFAGRDVADKRNLPFTAFTMYANSGPPYTDPELKTPVGAMMLFNNARGLFSFEAPFIDPHTGDTTAIMLAGDPVTGSGWLDRDNLPPGDRRFLASMGPISFAVQDTQEVIFARIVAEGGSVEEDITALRETARCIVRTYRDTPLAVPRLSRNDGLVIQGIAPNPVSPGNAIRIEVSTSSRYRSAFTIQLLDLLGRNLAEAEFESVSPSRTSVQFATPSALPSGLYQLRVSDGAHTQMKSLLLLR